MTLLHPIVNPGVSKAHRDSSIQGTDNIWDPTCGTGGRRKKRDVNDLFLPFYLERPPFEKGGPGKGLQDLQSPTTLFVES